MQEIRNVVNVLPVTPDNKVILGYKDRGTGGMWIPLGGKREFGENDESCIRRELSEELLIEPGALESIIEKLEWLGKFEGRTPNTGTPVVAAAYGVRIFELPSPNSEIQELRSFSSEECLQNPLVSEATKAMVLRLLEDGKLD